MQSSENVRIFMAVRIKLCKVPSKPNQSHKTSTIVYFFFQIWNILTLVKNLKSKNSVFLSSESGFRGFYATYPIFKSLYFECF
uniref:Uncharacterized protein n=1 Tax=Lepeophtheirus salmonis TaxID=72036 RepID=A0A0K2VEN8_LEPSM